MKILLLTFADDNMREMGDLSADNKLSYCQRHGYEFSYEQKTLEVLGDGRGNGSWQKILYLIKHLPDYDWIFWSDADALILNPDIKLEKFLPGDKGIDLILARDKQPWINCGNFFIRNCEWSCNFLQLVQLHNWTWKIDGIFGKYGWWEQGAIRYLLEQPYHANHVKYVTCREFNAYADFIREEGDLRWMKPDLWRPGDFLCHYSGLIVRNGVSNYQKVIEKMKSDLNKKRNPM